MTSNSKEEINRSAGAEYTLPCAKCAGKTVHEAVLSVDQSGQLEGGSIQWDKKLQIIRCKGCRTISFRSEASTSEDYIQISEDDWMLDLDEKLYPSRVDGIRDLGNDVIYLPQDLRRIYKETTHALISDCPVLAGIGLRALVESICKEKDASGKDLYEKINSLASRHILTPSGAEILHKVRTLGNDAVHEVKPHTLRQLSLAMGVVEHMLKDIYILPTLVRNEFR